MNIYEILEKKVSDKIAIIFKNCSISYRQLNNLVNEQCKKITTKEQIVALYLPNSLQYVVAYFSVLKLQKTIMPISINLKNSELLNYIKLGKITYIITDNKHYWKLKEDKNYSNISIYNIDTGDYKKSNCESSQIDNDLIDVALLLPTSGSTGTAKIVMLTHDNLLSNIAANVTALSITEKDTTYISLPMCYSYCNTAQFLSHIYVGATIVIQSSIMHMPSIIAELKLYSVTNYFCNPTVMNMFVEHINLFPAQLPSLRSFYIGTASVTTMQIERLVNLLPNINCYLTYGLTEASPRVTTYMVNKRKIKSSIGKPLKGIEVRIVNDNGEDVENNQIGEIIIKGPNIMKGYYGNFNESMNKIINGWLYTGDCATFDEDKNIIIKGRKKSVINCSGVIIYPEEIEEILLKHDVVKDAYVYGKLHSIYGEIVMADIILQEDVNYKQALKDLKKYCLINLSNIKIPQFKIVKCISKTNTNKNIRMR